MSIVRLKLIARLQRAGLEALRLRSPIVGPRIDDCETCRKEADEEYGEENPPRKAVQTKPKRAQGGQQSNVGNDKHARGEHEL